jgi:hypothetical protein
MDVTLENRVDPFGRLIRTPARGGWMGNRGLLHDGDRQIVRPWRLKAWLICRLEFRGRTRRVMTPGVYTELFFLDEATALAAGHRPCAECRRPDFQAFKAAAQASGAAGLERAGDLDQALHAQRLDGDGSKRMYRAEVVGLPDGVFVGIDGDAWLKRHGRLHRWTPAGYAASRQLPTGEAAVLTPRLTVEVIRSGYAPQMALRT